MQINSNNYPEKQKSIEDINIQNGESVLIDNKIEIENDFLSNIDNGLSTIQSKLLELIEFNFIDIENFINYDLEADSLILNEFYNKSLLIEEKIRIELYEYIIIFNENFLKNKDEIKSNGIHLFDYDNNIINDDILKYLSNLMNEYLTFTEKCNTLSNNYYDAIDYGINKESLLSDTIYIKEEFIKLYEEIKSINYKQMAYSYNI